MNSSFYQNKDRFLVAVDCIILGFNENELQILIARRPFEPLKGGWSLMGGFVNAPESLEEAAQRVLKEFTGINDIFMEQTGAYGELNRDIGERVVSVAYFALVDIDLFDTSLTVRYDARWVRLSKIPSLIFDHNIMVNDTIKILQRKAAVKPIGFNLLGEKFTLPTLQGLYESIYQESIDKRNFRKKLLSMDILTKLEEKDKNSSRKGAFLYSFNKEKYDLLIEQGLHFSL